MGDSAEVHGLAVEFLNAVRNGDAAAINSIMPGANVEETDLRDTDIPVKDLIKSIKVEKVPGKKAFRVHLGAFTAVAEPGEDGSWILKPGEIRTRTIDIIPAE